MEKGILKRLFMASYAESDATMKRRTGLKDYIRSIIATKRKVFNISKIKIYFVAPTNSVYHSFNARPVFFFYKVYPVSSSTGHRTETEKKIYI